MKIAPVADVKTHLSRFLSELRGEPVIVTRNGRPAALLVDISEEDDLEGLVLSHSRRFRRLIEEADVRARKAGVPHATFWRNLETPRRRVKKKRAT